jgi:hypothetical protein
LLQYSITATPGRSAIIVIIVAVIVGQLMVMIPFECRNGRLGMLL